MNRLKPDVLRREKPTDSDLKKINHNPIYLVIDNVIDTYNIGSLFRLADAIGAEKLFICGNTEYPPSSRIHKAAVGTENWVTFLKCASAFEITKQLQKHGVQIVSVEQDKRSVKIKDLNSRIKFPVAIVVGNETDGVSKEVLDLSDIIVELPMYGVNNSFNVWGSAAVVAYKILELL